MKNRVVVGVMLLFIIVYVFVLASMAVAFATAGGLGIIMAAGLFAILFASVWAVTREVRFGVDSTRLAQIISREDGVPLDTLPRDENGRIDPADAQMEWQRRKAIVDGAPEDWRAWFLLGIAYDNAHDRKQARAAIRKAVALFGKRAV